MVKKCSIKLCRSESYGGCGMSLHSFPKIKEFSEKWLDVIPVPLKVTKYSVVCSLHFRPEDFYIANSRRMLNAEAVLSIFPATTEQPKQLTVPQKCITKGTEKYLEIPTLTSETDCENSSQEYCSQEGIESNSSVPSQSQTNERSDPAYQRSRINFLEKKVQILQAKVKRKKYIQKNLIRMLKIVRSYTRSSELENILKGNFRKLCVAFNSNGVTVNYSEEVIKFAVTINYYSLKVYEFIRKYIMLPNVRMLQEYTTTGTYNITLDD